ncbi:MAG: putative zinc-binding protein [Candidatus Zixiibacteriota bacterium]
MYCLAGIGGRVKHILETTETAKIIFAIDGCSNKCAKKSLEKAGFNYIKDFALTDIGFAKDKTDVNNENIPKVITHDGNLKKKGE